MSSSPDASPLRRTASGRAFLSRLLLIFTAALSGYIWGWIWGWSLFDPNRDVWALAAAALGLVGLVAGLLGLFQKYAVAWLGATGGLFLGWYARTLIFGDHPGGWGLLLLLAGAVGAGWLARRLAWKLPVLLAALYCGFFGGFLIDVVLLDRVLGLVRVHSIQGQAPWVIAGACLGGWRARRRSLARRPARLPA